MRNSSFATPINVGDENPSKIARVATLVSAIRNKVAPSHPCGCCKLPLVELISYYKSKFVLPIHRRHPNSWSRTAYGQVPRLLPVRHDQNQSSFWPPQLTLPRRRKRLPQNENARGERAFSVVFGQLGGSWVFHYPRGCFGGLVKGRVNSQNP